MSLKVVNILPDIKCLALIPTSVIARGYFYISAVSILQLSNPKYMAEKSSTLPKVINISSSAVQNLQLSSQETKRLVQNIQWLGDNHKVVSGTSGKSTMNQYLFELFWNSISLLPAYSEPGIEKDQVILKDLSPAFKAEFESGVELPRKLVNDARFLAEAMSWNMSSATRLIVCSADLGIRSMLDVGLRSLATQARILIGDLLLMIDLIDICICENAIAITEDPNILASATRNLIDQYLK